MKRFTRVTFFAVSVSLGVVGAVYADPELAEEWGLDFWNYSHFERELKETTRLSNRLSANFEQTRARMEYRETLVDELVAGRATIDETVRQFQLLNKSSVTSPQMFRVLFGTDDDRCVAGRQLLLYLDSNAKHDPRFAPAQEDVRNWLVTHFAE